MCRDVANTPSGPKKLAGEVPRDEVPRDAAAVSRAAAAPSFPVILHCSADLLRCFCRHDALLQVLTPSCKAVLEFLQCQDRVEALVDFDHFPLRIIELLPQIGDDLDEAHDPLSSLGDEERYFVLNVDGEGMGCRVGPHHAPDVSGILFYVTFHDVLEASNQPPIFVVNRRELAPARTCLREDDVSPAMQRSRPS